MKNEPQMDKIATNCKIDMSSSVKIEFAIFETASGTFQAKI